MNDDIATINISVINCSKHGSAWIYSRDGRSVCLLCMEDKIADLENRINGLENTATVYEMYGMQKMTKGETDDRR